MNSKLPLNLDDLLRQRTVEGERIEYKMGCYFSINEAMLNNARHASVVAAIPFDRLLTETDGPFTKTAGWPAFNACRCICSR